MLSSDLDSEEEKDRSALDGLLSCLVSELNLCQAPGSENLEEISQRNPRHEVQLILMRLLSVFMSRSKAGTKATSEVPLSCFLTVSTSSVVYHGELCSLYLLNEN